MKYIVCLTAVILEFILFSLLGAAIGLTAEESFIPIMLLWAVWVATCRIIIRKYNAREKRNIRPRWL